MSPGKASQGQDQTLKFHPPGTHFPSILATHKHSTGQERYPKQSGQPGVMALQGAEQPHGGSRDPDRTSGDSPVSGSLGVGYQEMGQWGQGQGGEPWSKRRREGDHLSADPALRSRTAFTRPGNRLFLYSFLQVSPSSFFPSSLSCSLIFLPFSSVQSGSQLDITS